VKKIKAFILWAQSNGYEFARTDEFAKEIIKAQK
jgi:hypothetical protein